MRYILILAMLSLPLISSTKDKINIKQDKNGNILLYNIPEQSMPVPPKPAAQSEPGKMRVPYRYLVKIRQLSAKHNLREDLIIAVAKAESSFNPNAVSKKGAVGLMQLMKGTAKDYGVSNRYDPDRNLEAGVKHLKKLYLMYDKNLPLTLAAYNAGIEAVKKYKGIPPFKETKNYIRRVMRYMGLEYTGVFAVKQKTKIYKYTTPSGKIVITDRYPSGVKGKVEIIE